MSIVTFFIISVILLIGGFVALCILLDLDMGIPQIAIPLSILAFGFGGIIGSLVKFCQFDIAIENKDVSKYDTAIISTTNIIEIIGVSVPQENNSLSLPSKYTIAYIEKDDDEYVAKTCSVVEIKIDSSIDEDYFFTTQYTSKGIVKVKEETTSLIIKDEQQLEKLLNISNCSSDRKNIILREVHYNAK